jgi:uncharacterized membrane protein YfcA
MSPELQTVVVAAVMFLAALTRSTFGFGEALVAMPLLAIVLNQLETASALVAINSMFNSILILWTGKESTDWRGGWRLLVASLAGIPLGVFALPHVPEVFVKSLLAVVLATFALYNLCRPGTWRLKRDCWAFPFGFVGGVLGGAYNTSGPAMVAFGSLRGWTPAQLRATLQGVFLPNSLSVLAMHYAAGWWSPQVFDYLIWTLPLVLVTVPIGYWLNRRIHPEHFQRLLHVLLLALAGLLFWSTWKSAEPRRSTATRVGNCKVHFAVSSPLIPAAAGWRADRQTGLEPAGMSSLSAVLRA